MSTVASPFLKEITSCKLTMRKLRKKISKQCSSQQSKKKTKDNTTDQVIEIFRQRNIPEFVTEALKKRRNFDMGSIKSIVINQPLPLEEIRNRANLQQVQVDSLYFDHKKRMEEERKKAELNNSVRIQFSQSNIYSSTNEDDYVESLFQSAEPSIEEEGSNYFQNLQEQSKEPIFTDNYLHLNESSINSDLDLFNF